MTILGSSYIYLRWRGHQSVNKQNNNLLMNNDCDKQFMGGDNLTQTICKMVSWLVLSFLKTFHTNLMPTIRVKCLMVIQPQNILHV